MIEKSLYILPLMLFLLGIFFLGITFLVDKMMQSSKNRCTYECWARMVDTKRVRHSNSEGHDFFTLNGVYEYTIYNGQTVTAVSTIGYGGVEKNVGKQYKIKYNPEQPTEFYVPEEESKMNIVWKIMYGVGFTILASSIIVLIIFLVLNKTANALPL